MTAMALLKVVLILIWPFPLKVSEGESLGFQKDTECSYQMQGEEKTLWLQRPWIHCRPQVT